MRNNWMKRILTAACIMALLTGCGAKTPADTQQPGEEPAPETPAEETKPDMTLDQVMEANKIENLLKNHSAVKIKTELYEQEGDETPVSSTLSSYTMENGFLQSFREFTDRDGGKYYEEGHADQVYSGALYAMNGDGGNLYMAVCPADEYDDIITVGDDPAMQDGTEAVLMDASWQDGAAILMVRVTYRDVSDSYDLIYYYADPDTCELYAMDVYSYSTADDSPMGVTQIQYTYDDPDSPAASPFQAVTGGTDYCELSVIVDYMGENQAVYWYPVANDTQVYFQTVREGVRLYKDDDMTESAKQYDAIDVSGDVSNLFVVFGEQTGAEQQ